MSRTVYCGYYPNKCNDNDILKYLNYDSIYDCSYDHLSDDFYKNCRALAEYNEESDCYIFTDMMKLFTFAESKETPVSMSDYITDEYQQDYVFILWIR